MPPDRKMAVPAETVLLVDDEPLILEVCGAVLRNSGYEVLCSRNGRTGLELFGKHKDRIQLLVSDVLMPDMRGTEMAQRMLAEKPGLRVVFISGYGLGSIPESLEGKLRVLAKPFTSEQLLRAVSAALAGDRRQSMALGLQSNTTVLPE